VDVVQEAVVDAMSRQIEETGLVADRAQLVDEARRAGRRRVGQERRTVEQRQRGRV
jgi:hypothetical protein